MATYLDGILLAHRLTAAGDHRQEADLRRHAEAAPPPRGFAAALRAAEGLAVIAEVKRRSPSKGDLFADLDPAALARQYEAGGATCLSVLTDEVHFGGSRDDLVAAREACRLPVLRKDFTVSVNDVLDARIMGADCVLLIAAALDDDELAVFHRVATEVGLDALVEVHDEAELERALEAGATLIGVNQRDLVTFEVDHERAARMAQAFPDHVVSVAESGVRGPEDAAVLADAGYDAVLVGESLVTAGDPTAAVAALRAAAR
ncbi:MAG TPA: indole-3-glycerol phosphate synthase TrpC [Acidimicrobiales bacterium]|nr:indole-3-glycerol phosphate synthase TrpC [Acidimicrobiales bacterium]